LFFAHCYLHVSNFSRSLPEDSKPIKLPTGLEIPRQAKDNYTAAVNGNGTTTSSISVASAIPGTKRKRDDDEVEPSDEQIRKKGKVPETNGNSSTEVVVIDDDGAIMIDD